MEKSKLSLAEIYEQEYQRETFQVDVFFLKFDYNKKKLKGGNACC
jgi:hypothetical protein